MRQTKAVSAVALLGTIVAGSCTSERVSPRIAQRDSAGIRVWEIDDDVPRRAYTLSSSPTLTMGGASGDPQSELYGVSGAVVLSDGRVVVANAGTRELKLFDAAGSHVTTVGGQGKGPGEFTGIDLIAHLHGDSILTFDWSQSRFQVFDASLALGRVTVVQVPAELGSAGVNPVAAFPDGRFVGRGAAMVLEYPREALQRHVFLMSAEGEVVDSLGPFAGGRRIWMSGEPWPPFERKTAFVPWDESIYTATSESSEFRRVMLDGRVAEIVRGGLSSRSPTQRDIDAAMRGRLPSGVGDPWVSELLPFWSEFAVDDVGAVWRRLYAELGATSAEWFVVEAGGAGLGSLHTSLSFKPLRIGSDWVLALEKDSLDVERIARYELSRGDG